MVLLSGRRVRRAVTALVTGIFATLAVGQAVAPAGDAAGNEGVPAPEFTHTAAESWLNGEPQSLALLRGRVVLVDFWTFDCWNCYRSIPWLKSLEARFADEPFSVIGVHTPEFEHERKPENVRAKIAEFGLTHPVMLDNDFSYWRAMGNRYWPAFYLIDKHGRVREAFIGETHEGDRQARRVHDAVTALLKEP